MLDPLGENGKLRGASHPIVRWLLKAELFSVLRGNWRSLKANFLRPASYRCDIIRKEQHKCLEAVHEY